MSPLRRRMIEDMQIRNLAAHTQRGYVGLPRKWGSGRSAAVDGVGVTTIGGYHRVCSVTEDG